MSSGIFVTNQKRFVTIRHLPESQPGYNGHDFQGVSQSKLRLLEESQNKELAVTCKWHPVASSGPQSQATSGRLAYTLGSLMRTSSNGIRGRLLHLISRWCSVFLSGLRSTIKMKVSTLPVDSLYSNTGFWREHMSTSAWGFPPESQRNPDIYYWPYIQGCISFFSSCSFFQQSTHKILSFGENSLSLSLLFDYQVHNVFFPLKFFVLWNLILLPEAEQAGTQASLGSHSTNEDLWSKMRYKETVWSNQSWGGVSMDKMHGDLSSDLQHPHKKSNV